MKLDWIFLAVWVGVTVFSIASWVLILMVMIKILRM